MATRRRFTTEARYTALEGRYLSICTIMEAGFQIGQPPSIPCNNVYYTADGLAEWRSIATDLVWLNILSEIRPWYASMRASCSLSAYSVGSGLSYSVLIIVSIRDFSERCTRGPGREVDDGVR